MQMFSMIRKGGTYIIIGLTQTVTLDKLLMTRNEYRVIACTLFLPEDFKNVMDLLESGKLNIRNLVTRIAKFEDAQECFADLASGDTANCKILFRVPEF
jgi:threonine dehydrogenase-like Zn-dependent dehydrogenase